MRHYAVFVAIVLDLGTLQLSERENAMIEEGRGYAAAIALQHLLRTLEAKGIMETAETTAMLEGVLTELDDLQKNGVMSAEVNAAARKAIGIMYLPIRK